MKKNFRLFHFINDNALDEKIRLNKEYLASDKSAIAAYGAVFDEEGRISNYNELIEQ